jgi:hypothetical protein
MAINKLPLLYISLLLSYTKILAQPFTDIASFSTQQLNTKYTSNIGKNTTTNYFAGLLVPLKIDSNNNIIIRLNGEELATKITLMKLQKDVYMH